MGLLTPNLFIITTVCSMKSFIFTVFSFLSESVVLQYKHVYCVFVHSTTYQYTNLDCTAVALFNGNYYFYQTSCNLFRQNDIVQPRQFTTASVTVGILRSCTGDTPNFIYIFLNMRPGYLVISILGFNNVLLSSGGNIKILNHGFNVYWNLSQRFIK